MSARDDYPGLARLMFVQDSDWSEMDAALDEIDKLRGAMDDLLRIALDPGYAAAYLAKAEK